MLMIDVARQKNITRQNYNITTIFQQTSTNPCFMSSTCCLSPRSQWVHLQPAPNLHTLTRQGKLWDYASSKEANDEETWGISISMCLPNGCFDKNKNTTQFHANTLLVLRFFRAHGILYLCIWYNRYPRCMSTKLLFAPHHSFKGDLKNITSLPKSTSHFFPVNKQRLGQKRLCEKQKRESCCGRLL